MDRIICLYRRLWRLQTLVASFVRWGCGTGWLSWNSREHFPRNIPARMSTSSLTCREDIGRVGRVGRGRYEDPCEDVRRKSCVSGQWNSEKHPRHDTRTNGHHYTAADRWPTNQISAWQAGRGSRPKRRHHREDVGACRACRRRCHVDHREETASVEFKSIWSHASSGCWSPWLKDVSATMSHISAVLHVCSSL